MCGGANYIINNEKKTVCFPVPYADLEATSILTHGDVILNTA